MLRFGTIPARIQPRRPRPIAGFRGTVHVVGVLMLNGMLLASWSLGQEKTQASSGSEPLTLRKRTSAALQPWLTSLPEAYRRATSEQKPILVRARTKSCGWCRKLTEEMETPEVQAALAQWTLVSIDCDASPEEADQLGVVSVPALRILAPGGRRIASHDGFLGAERLVSWLKKQYPIATAKKEWEGGETLDLVGVMKLLKHLSDRDPAVREAAVGRLIRHPQTSAPAVIKALGDGKLAVRLAALEVLQGWHAPLEGLDPWRPETIPADRLAALEQWSQRLSAAEPEEPEKLDERTLASARESIARMLKVSPAEAAAVREQLARLGTLLLPEVYERLKTVSTDAERHRLSLLRYRLAASDTLALDWPGGLERLASADSTQRQQAAEELSRLATDDDQPLLLELFSDPDPLVREISLRGLKNLGGQASVATLVRLLQDPSANVRAAVLKQLAEDPPKGMVAKVADYLKQEKDGDLTVHGIRFLQGAGGAAAIRSLIPLLEHDSWQVRAETAEALGKLIGHMYDSKFDEIKADTFVALIQRLDDPDPFVVSRAVGALEDADMEVAVKPLVQSLLKHPNLATEIVKILSQGAKMRSSALPHLRKLTKHEDPQVRGAAIEGLAQTAPDEVPEPITAALRDPDRRLRISAVTTLGSLLQTRCSDMGQQFEKEPFKARTGWDEKLKGFYAGKGRPKWTGAMIEPLEKMLRADNVEERALAAKALVPLGKVETALPVLRESARSASELAERIAGVLPWLVWEERTKLFDYLRTLTRNDEQFSTLVEAACGVPDHHSVELCWKLLEEPKLSAEIAARCMSKLRELYLGEHYYDLDRVKPADLRAMAEAAKDRVSAGPELLRLAALILLSEAAEDKAVELAAALADNPKESGALRRDAFQLSLATDTESRGTAKALAALSGVDSLRREVALRYLAEGRSAMSQFREHLRRARGFQSSRSDSSEAIVAAAPRGLKAEQVRPLSADPDPKVAAYAGYLLALLGEPKGLEKLLTYWRSQEEPSETLDRLVYRAIATLDDSSHLAELRVIYGRLERYNVQEFYWTVRSMTGPEVLKFRKRIRDEVGMDNLR